MIHLWLFSTIFTWVLTLNRGALTPTLVLSLALLMLCIFKIKQFRIRKSGLILFVSFAFVCFLSALLNYDVVRISHLLALTGTCIVFYFIPMTYIDMAKINLLSISKTCASIALIYAAVLVIEFCSRNFFGFDFRAGMPIFFADLPESTFLGQFYRARGFASEPGHAAFNLMVLIILGSQYLSTEKSVLRLGAYIFCVFLAVLSTASPVPFFSLPVSILMATTLIVISSRIFMRPRMILSFAIFGGLFFIADLFFLGADSYIQNQLLAKLISYSMDDRMSRLAGLLNFLDSESLLFGVSAGASVIMGEGQTQLSLYPLVLMEAGFLGFGLMCWFILSRLIGLIRMRESKEAFIGLVAVCYVILNGFVISNYYYPAFWLPFLYASILVNRTRRVNVG